MARGIDYFVRTWLDTKMRAGASARLKKWTGGIQAASARMTQASRAMMGTTLQSAAGIGKVAGAMGALGAAGGMGALVKSGVEFNNSLEQSKYSMASTLQLMGHKSGDFAKNLEVAEAAMDQVFKIAAKSPASFEQASTMFKNMLPGARSVTDSMEEILKLSKDSLALGMIMGGDFATTGAQMSRIMTGGAGAEFETWKVMQTAIRDVGMELGHFNKALQYGQDTTKAWNALDPAKRWEILRQAVGRLGVATKAFGETWAGVTSTMLSEYQMFKKAIGETIFLNMKARFKSWMGKGSLLDPEGKVVKSLLEFAGVLGYIFAKGADKIANAFETGAVWLAGNWWKVVDGFGKFVDQFAQGVVTLAKFKGAQMAVGAGVGAMGAIGSVLGALASAAPAIIAIGPAVLLLIPAFAAIAGAAVVAGAVIAFFVTRWDELVEGVRSGAIVITPVLDVIDLFWAKLIAVGAAMLGTTDTVEGANVMIGVFTGAIEGLMDVIAGSLWVFGAFKRVWNIVKIAVLGIAALVVDMLEAIVNAANWAQGKIGAFIAEIPGLGETGAAMVAASAKGPQGLDKEWKILSDSLDSDLQAIGKDMDSDFAAYDAWKKGSAEARKKLGAEDFMATSRREKKVLDLLNFTKKKLDPKELLGGGTKSSADMVAAGARGRGNINVNKMVVNQDLRNQDPDRVIGAFYKGIEKSVKNRTQSLALDNEGV